MTIWVALVAVTVRIVDPPEAMGFLLAVMLTVGLTVADEPPPELLLLQPERMTVSEKIMPRIFVRLWVIAPRAGGNSD